MNSCLIVIFAVVSLASAQGGELQCKPNESYTTCGTACEPSCETPNPEACTLQCVVGCQCDKGFYRNENKDCVKLEECPANPAGSRALRSSRSSSQSRSSRSADSSRDSSDSGENRGNREQLGQPGAPQKCEQNEQIFPCKNECSEKKCGQTEEKACTKECRGPGCACKPGFFRNTAGKCVTQQECGAQ